MYHCELVKAQSSNSKIKLGTPLITSFLKKVRGCRLVQKDPKKSIERQIHLEKINYLCRISSSHADFDKKKVVCILLWYHRVILTR